MRLSVIVPAYREGGEAAEGIHSLARHPQVHEVVVATRDCSPGFLRMLARVPKVRCLRAPRRGRGAQMNFGAAAAAGDLLLFLHADSRLGGEGVEELARTLRDPSLAGGAFRLRFDRRDRKYRFKAWTANARSRLLGMPYGDQGLFVRAGVFRSLGGFKDWPLFEDVDFFDRLKKRWRWVLLGAAVTTSARRWERKGYWKATLQNMAWILLYKLGVPPRRLSKHY